MLDGVLACGPGSGGFWANLPLLVILGVFYLGPYIAGGAAIWGIAAGVRNWPARKERERPRQVCATCGYDVRATPDPGGPLLPACPECGSAIVELETQEDAPWRPSPSPAVRSRR